MSDFIARMAARAVGAAPVAQPRLPALFEDPGPGGSLGLEIADDEVVAPASRSAPGESGESGQPATPPADPTAPAGSVVNGSAVAETPQPLRPRTVALSALVPPENLSTPVLDVSIDPVVEAGEQPQPTVHVLEELIEAPGTPIPAVAAATAASPAPAAPAILSAAAVRSSRSAPTPDQPTVHIRIGRLEVRANLRDEPPPRPQQHEPAHEDALSLSDYLRGERGGP